LGWEGQRGTLRGGDRLSLQRPLLCTVKSGIIQGDFTRVFEEGTHGSTFLDQRLLPADSECLARPLFPHPGLFDDLDFSAMKETQPDELFAVWLALPDSQRHKMDAELVPVIQDLDLGVI
jgi:hypothetical protein